MRQAAINSRFNFSKAKTPVFTRPIPSPAITNEIIKLEEIRRAAKRIGSYIKRTPTVSDSVLSSRFGANFYLKLELLQTTGAFKVRGAFNKMLTLNNEEKERGIVAVSA